jgi:hypothetical protein
MVWDILVIEELAAVLETRSVPRLEMEYPGGREVGRLDDGMICGIVDNTGNSDGMIGDALKLAF